MRAVLQLCLVAALGCGSAAQHGDAAVPADDAGAGEDGGSADGGAGSDGGADAAMPCTTRIDYGASWIHAANHPASFDVADGVVTWDRVCHDDGGNSYALLSNGWKPYFTGNAACSVTFDYPSCGVYANPVLPTGCADP